jgi:enamine deaminase RidA (YjgF/YER057c/UK114 family)
MKFSILKFQAPPSASFSSSLDFCFNQLTKFENNLHSNQHIIKISLFAACTDNDDYRRKKRQMTTAATCFSECDAPLSLISQPPLDKKITLEIWMLDQVPSGTAFTYKSVENGSSLSIENGQFNLLISTQQCNQHAQYKQNVSETFQQLDQTLSREGFNYGDIVRQWNYIENITLTEAASETHRQNYQIFNDYRTLFYQKSIFPNGYPAATGIGIENGGCLIDMMALKTKVVNHVIPIGNSLQVNAQDYTDKVLVGKVIDEIKQISTPKFERAKFVNSVIDGFFYISGTASILGEKTVFENDIANQTLTTLRNISHLISGKNLFHYHIPSKSTPHLGSYRVYIKNETDYPIVKEICDKYFGINTGVFVKAGICRNNLLVEIEATYAA